MLISSDLYFNPRICQDLQYLTWYFVEPNKAAELSETDLDRSIVVSLQELSSTEKSCCVGADLLIPIRLEATHE